MQLAVIDQADPTVLPKRREFRVVVQEGRGMSGGDLFTVDRVLISSNGGISSWGGSSPFGYSIDAFKADCLDYLAALHRPWIKLYKEESKPFTTYLPVVTKKFEKGKVKAFTPTEREWDYRIGVDAKGTFSVYQCHLYPSGSVVQDGVYEDVNGCCSCGYTEIEFVRDLMLYVECSNKPIIDVTKLKD